MLPNLGCDRAMLAASYYSLVLVTGGEIFGCAFNNGGLSMLLVIVLVRTFIDSDFLGELGCGDIYF